jgi:diacylglycerol kinase family enzyme
MVVGTWGSDRVIEYEKVQQLTVMSKKRRLMVSMDGDVLTLDTPLNFAVHPKSLTVLAPALPVETPDAQLATPEAA